MEGLARQFIPSLNAITRKSKNAGQPALIYTVSTPKKKVEYKKEYKIPKTPKTSGIGWGF